MPPDNIWQTTGFLWQRHHGVVPGKCQRLNPKTWLLQVRAAVPMYILSRKIKAMGVKVVCSGEGADEMFGGYLYFHKAPNAAEFHK